ncbi:hypothetical protein V3595_10720 [Bacillus sp. CFBP9009]
MSEQFRIETEEIGKEVKKLISNLFEGRFRSQRNTQINDYEWESLVNDQDLGKQFTMVIKALKDGGGIDINFHTVDNDDVEDIEESVKAIHKKMNFILRISRIFKIGGLESL